MAQEEGTHEKPLAHRRPVNAIANADVFSCLGGFAILAANNADFVTAAVQSRATGKVLTQAAMLAG